VTRGHDDPPSLGLRDVPFARLIEVDPDLADARRHYAKASAKRRRAAAEWEYDAVFAGNLFATAMGHLSDAVWEADPALEGVLALAIDPLFAPALLTVGSIEYQCGRPEAAMEHFLNLTALPENEPDIVEIIDKAGYFLFDEKDYQNALRLYEAAAEARPSVAAYWSGVGYCLGKLGRLEEALAATRRALDLEPDNAVWLSDLGWALVEMGNYEDARPLLERAVALAPADFELAGENLKELDRLTGRPATDDPPAP
jgi:tetratricopeptide (TPR) repeat protein